MWPRHARLPALLVLTLLVALCWLTRPAPAAASCVTDRPPKSPAAFIGVVVETRSKGRVATVRTDAGATVTVLGTPALSGSGGTSVDRTYEVGGRYEFHPVNGTSPFEDNACTATRLLSGGPRPAASSSAQGSAEQRPEAPTAARGSRAATAVLAAVVVGAVGTAGVVLRRRGRSRASGRDT